MWWRLVLKEIVKRKWGFLFSATAIAVAIGALALVVAVTTSLEEEARLIGTRMKQNIMIVPADVQLDDYHRGDFGNFTLPESLFQAVADKSTFAMIDRTSLSRKVQLTDEAGVKRAEQEKGKDNIVSYAIPALADHFLAQLQQRVTAHAGEKKMEVILTGQQKQEGRKKPIVSPAEPGTAYLGYGVAAQLGLAKDGVIRIGDRDLKVARVEESQGTIDDIRVYTALSDAQQILGRKGQINCVVALGCICQGVTIGELSRTLELHINGWVQKHASPAQVRVFAMERLATARLNLRTMIGGVATVLAPIFAIICAALVCGYFYFNVRERRQEMGVLLAVGFTPTPIMLAILFKLVLVSTIGGLAGTLAGLALAVRLGPAFLLTKVIWPANIWQMTMGLAVGLTLLAGIYPLLLAWRVRAADILRNS